MFDKILIANRGEIALRIHRACRELGIKTVAVHSEADRDAMHVRLADESVCIGPPPARDSYLNIPAIIVAAESPTPRRSIPATASCRRTPTSPRSVEAHGFTFIGPTPEHIRMMGDKIVAKQTAQGRSACRWCPAPTGPVGTDRGGRRARPSRSAIR